MGKVGFREGVTRCDAFSGLCDVAMTEEKTSFAELVRGGVSLAEAYRRTHKRAEGMKAGALRMAAKRLADRLGVVVVKGKAGVSEADRAKIRAASEVLEEIRAEVRGDMRGRIADDRELQEGLTGLFRKAVRDVDRMGAVRLAAELRAWRGTLTVGKQEVEGLPVGEVVQEILGGYEG